MSLTSIIIPTYQEKEMLVSCIDFIRRYTPEPHEIIVIDNGSTDGTAEYCHAQGFTFVSFPVNQGFPIACNIGLKIARGDQLLLLNNDVIVSPGWLTNMLSCLNSHEDIGMVGPTTNYVFGMQKVDLPPYDLNQYLSIAKERNQPNQTIWKKVNRLVGFCLLFKRALLEAIGYLDEQFSPGHFEDDDYCYRAKLAGFQLMMAGDVYVHHYGSISFKKDPQAQALLVERNYELFKQKWGFDPRQVT